MKLNSPQNIMYTIKTINTFKYQDTYFIFKYIRVCLTEISTEHTTLNSYLKRF